MSETNDNFETLKRMLKLKRHEVPPPGYFNNFSGTVIARIRAGDTGAKESFFERLQSDAAFWDKLLHIFRVRPGIIGGLATGICLLFLVGVVMLDQSEGGPVDTDSIPAQAAPATPEASPTLASAVTLSAPSGGLMVSTNPIASLQPISSLNGSPENPMFQPVGYLPSGQ